MNINNTNAWNKDGKDFIEARQQRIAKANEAQDKLTQHLLKENDAREAMNLERTSSKNGKQEQGRMDKINFYKAIKDDASVRILQNELDTIKKLEVIT